MDQSRSWIGCFEARRVVHLSLKESRVPVALPFSRPMAAVPKLHFVLSSGDDTNVAYLSWWNEAR